MKKLYLLIPCCFFILMLFLPVQNGQAQYSGYTFYNFKMISYGCPCGGSGQMCDWSSGDECRISDQMPCDCPEA